VLILSLRWAHSPLDSRAVRRRRIAALAGVALALSVALPAVAADPEVPTGYRELESGLDSAIGINCTSIVTGNPFEETQVTAAAAAQGSAKRRIKPGRVFYVRASVGIVGETCNGALVEIEVVPPRGVKIAYSKARPYWVDYPEDADPPSYSNGNDGMRASRGRHGGELFRAFADGELQPWPLSNDSGPIQIHVPMRATRAVNGSEARRPRCRAKGAGAPPCSPMKARDHAQVVADIGAAVAPTLLVAEAGLFARAPGR
jgi:hypothetical protein